jgi:hypothetical protein
MGNVSSSTSRASITSACARLIELLVLGSRFVYTCVWLESGRSGVTPTCSRGCLDAERRERNGSARIYPQDADSFRPSKFEGRSRSAPVSLSRLPPVSPCLSPGPPSSVAAGCGFQGGACGGGGGAEVDGGGAGWCKSAKEWEGAGRRWGSDSSRREAVAPGQISRRRLALAQLRRMPAMALPWRKEGQRCSCCYELHRLWMRMKKGCMTCQTLNPMTCGPTNGVKTAIHFISHSSTEKRVGTTPT